MGHGLSKRGEAAKRSVLRMDMDAYFEATSDIFDPEGNPAGKFPLNVAENRQSWDTMHKKMQAIVRETDIPDWVPGYTSGLGAPEFREAVAAFFTKFLTGCPINPDHLACSAGATGVIELTSMVLCDAGDVVAIPSPCYPVYSHDMGKMAGLERFDIITHHDISELHGSMPLTTQHLEEASQQIISTGKNLRMVILTNPDNPTGGFYSQQQLLEITEWCLANEVHLVVNEIYGLTILDTSRPEIRDDYPEILEFYSFGKIIRDKKSPYLHLWYSFSKDFGISGFRVGVVHSLNEDFIRAYENLNYSHLVSNYTQWLLAVILADGPFLQSYIADNQKKLTDAYIVVVKSLKSLNIPYVPARGSLFIWLDLSRLLKNHTQEGENALWMELFTETGILLTPGEGFGHSKKGLFRMVYPYFRKEDLEIAMDRFESFYRSKRPGV